MQNISSIKNKEMLWNILYEKQIFNGILNSDLEEVKTLFENAINNTVNNHIIDLNNNKINIIDINKLILEKVIIYIKDFKNQKLEGKSVKDNFKNEKIKIFDRDLYDKINSFNNSMNINKPKDINFLDNLDEPLDNDEMTNKLKQIEKERNINMELLDTQLTNNNTNNTNNTNNSNNNNNDIINDNLNNKNENDKNNENLTNKLKINKQMLINNEENNIENKINKLDEKLKDIYNILNEILSNQQKLMQNNR